MSPKPNSSGQIGSRDVAAHGDAQSAVMSMVVPSRSNLPLANMRNRDPDDDERTTNNSSSRKSSTRSRAISSVSVSTSDSSHTLYRHPSSDNNNNNNKNNNNNNKSHQQLGLLSSPSPASASGSDRPGSAVSPSHRRAKSALDVDVDGADARSSGSRHAKHGSNALGAVLGSTTLSIRGGHNRIGSLLSAVQGISTFVGGRYRSSSQQDIIPAPLSARFAESLAIKRPSLADLARTKVKGWASDKRKLQLVCAYVPGLVVDEFIAGGGEVSLPKSIAFDAAVLFADISGFSRLAEKLVHTFKDAANAAEMLTNYIGRSLDRMVNTICAKGGDVVKFAGDAILAVFPAKIFQNQSGGKGTGTMEDGLAQATLCCAQVAKQLGDTELKVGDSDTGGVVVLKIHCGMGTGSVAGFHVGGLEKRWEFVLNGDPLEQIRSAEPEAGPGEVVMSKEAYQMLGNSVEGTRLRSGNIRLDEILKRQHFDNQISHSKRLTDYLESRPQEVDKVRSALSHYIPNPARMLIKANQNIWNAEFRFCATMFVAIRGLEFSNASQESLELAQETVEMVQHSVYAFEGTLCRFIVDDKGASFLIAFGLPPFKHENDSLRAVEAGLMIHARLPGVLQGHSGKEVVCSIGVNSGRVFCGSVGGRLRCEYTLHGTSVNMAARFMQHAKGTILCGGDTYKDCESAIDFAPPKLIRVKGKNEKIKSYKPFGKKQISSVLDGDVRTVGRRAEKQMIRELFMQNVEKPAESKALIVEGEAGIGKTRLINYIVSEGTKDGFFCVYAAGNDVERKTPYFVFRQIIQQLLELHECSYNYNQVTWKQRQVLVESGLFDVSLGEVQNLSWSRKQQMLNSIVSGLGSNEKLEALAQALPNLFQGKDGRPQRPNGSNNRNSGGDFPKPTPLASSFAESDDGGSPRRGGGGNNKNSNTSHVIGNMLTTIVAAVAHQISARGARDRTNTKRLAIVIDSLQWVDEQSLDIIRHLIRNVPKIFVVIATRNPGGSLVDSRKGNRDVARKIVKVYNDICKRPGVHVARLQYFTQRELNEAIAFWMSVGSVADMVVDMVFNKTKGHPWFSHEFCKLLREMNLIEISTARGTTICKLSRDALTRSYALPENIAAMLTSRLDHLPPSQLALLKVAAVVGGSFQASMIAALMPYAEGNTRSGPGGRSRGGSTLRSFGIAGRRPTIPRIKSRLTVGARMSMADEEEVDMVTLRHRVETDIAALVKQDILVEIEGDMKVNPFYSYKSSMLKDTAYNLLLYQVRRELHGHVADFVERRHKSYLEPYVGTLAEHYHEAHIFKKALIYLELAGDASLQIKGMSTAHSNFSKILRLDPKYTDHLPIARRAGWHRKLGESLLYFGNVEEAEECLNDALDLLGLNTVQSTSAVDVLKQTFSMLSSVSGGSDRRKGPFLTLFGKVFGSGGSNKGKNNQGPQSAESSSSDSTHSREAKAKARRKKNKKRRPEAIDLDSLLEASKAYDLLGHVNRDLNSILARDRCLRAIQLGVRAAELTPDYPTKVPAELGRALARAAVFFAGQVETAELASELAEKAASSVGRMKEGDAQALVNMRLGEYFLLVGVLENVEEPLTKAEWSCKFMAHDRMRFQCQLLKISLHLFRGDLGGCVAITDDFDWSRDELALAVRARVLALCGEYEGAIEALGQSSYVPGGGIVSLLMNLDDDQSEELSEPEACIAITLLCTRALDKLVMSVQANHGNIFEKAEDIESQYKIMGSCLKFLLLAAKRLISSGFQDLPISRFHTITFLFTAYNDLYEWSREYRYKAGVKLSREHRRVLTGVVDIAIKYGLRYPVCVEHALLCEGYHGKLLRKDKSKDLMKRCATAVIPVELRSNYVSACARWELRDVTDSPDMSSVSHMFEQSGSPYEAQLVEERSSALYANMAASVRTATHSGGISTSSNSLHGAGRSTPSHSLGIVHVRRPHMPSKADSHSVHASGVHGDEVGVEIEDLSKHPAFQKVVVGTL